MNKRLTTKGNDKISLLLKLQLESLKMGISLGAEHGNMKDWGVNCVFKDELVTQG